MNWQPSAGTEAITSWINQGMLFALVLAVAFVIGSAVMWAVGSLGGNGEAASRGRTGIMVSLVAALLLGAGFTWLHWTDTQAHAFAGDPAAYGFNDKPEQPPQWEVVDITDRWAADINRVRAKDGEPPLTTSGALTDKARSCAMQRTGQPGDCPVNTIGCKESTGMLFGAWEYGPDKLDLLKGNLPELVVRDPNPWGYGSVPSPALDPSTDLRTAWVAVVDHGNNKAVLVGMFENGSGLAVWNKCLVLG